MSIGRFQDDMYHVMGYTPDSLRPYFSEMEESLLDLGVVTLPEGRSILSDLVNGDIFSFAPEGHEGEPCQARFLRSG